MDFDIQVHKVYINNFKGISISYTAGRKYGVHEEEQSDQGCGG